MRRIVESAAESHIEVLTLYAFSADNWLRPRREVVALMHLMKRYLVSERLRCIQHGIRVNVIGRRDRLAPVAGLSYIRLFIAGATNRGATQARKARSKVLSENGISCPSKWTNSAKEPKRSRPIPDSSPSPGFRRCAGS